MPDGFEFAGGSGGGTGGPNEPGGVTTFEAIPELAFPEPTPGGAVNPGTVRTRDPAPRRNPNLPLLVRGSSRPSGGLRRTELEFGERDPSNVESAKRTLAAQGPDPVKKNRDRPEASATDAAPATGQGGTFAPPGRVLQELRELWRGDREKVSPEVRRSASLAGVATAFLLGGFGGG